MWYTFLLLFFFTHFLLRWSNIQSGHITPSGWSQPSEGQLNRRLGETQRARWATQDCCYYWRTPHRSPAHQECCQRDQEIPGQAQLLHGYPGASRRWRNCCRSGYLADLLWLLLPHFLILINYNGVHDV